MFAKIFESIYDGTLAENWQGLVTFQQLLILAGRDGMVDMTPGAIARKTGIPQAIIDEGLAFLVKPDPQSRSKDMGGARIALIDPENRAWGWFVVNHDEYRRRISLEEKRENDRERQRTARAAGRTEPVQSTAAEASDEPLQPATPRDESQPVAKSRGCSTVQSTEYREKQKQGAAASPPPLAKEGRFSMPDDVVAAEVWAEFLEMRRRIRKPATDRACALIAIKLVELRRQGHDPTKVLEQSIVNSWQDVFPLKPENGNHGTARQSAADRVAEINRRRDPGGHAPPAGAVTFEGDFTEGDRHAPDHH